MLGPDGRHHVVRHRAGLPHHDRAGVSAPEGPLPPARGAARLYHRLNGVGTWFAERRGVLESAGLDHDVLDETALAGAALDRDAYGAVLAVGSETYRTVVLPVRALHTAAAATLARFAEAGGRVVCVGRAPALFLGAASRRLRRRRGLRPRAAAGLITVVAEPEEVPAAVAGGPLRVVADAPCLLRRDGATHILALIAHDGLTGTRAPIVSLGTDDWTTQDNFSWSEYWRRLHEDGYTYIPSAGRSASVVIEGLAGAPRAQRWDPGTGERTELDVRPGKGGGWLLDVPFADGAVALVVFGEDLPAPTRRALGRPVAAVEVAGPWRALATSTLDNRWGDLAAADRHGILPLEVWRMRHREGEHGPWRPVTAGFGPFARVRHGGGDEEQVEWSLSRGIRDDPVHDYRLGPKGYVPEEFLDVRRVAEGGEVSVRTPPDAARLRGSPVARGGRERRSARTGRRRGPAGSGSGLPVLQRAAGRSQGGPSVELEFILTRARTAGAGAFAVVPTWTRTAAGADVGGGAGGRRPRRVARRLTLEGRPRTRRDRLRRRVHGAGQRHEVGRQGDFNPYPDHRQDRVHPYDLRERLRPRQRTCWRCD